MLEARKSHLQSIAKLWITEGLTPTIIKLAAAKVCLMDWEYGPNRGKSYAESVVKLVFHFFGTAIIFLFLAAVTWLLGVALHWLNSIHPFSEVIWKFFVGVEAAILYFDAAVSGFVLLAGTWKFCKDITRGQS